MKKRNILGIGIIFLIASCLISFSYFKSLNSYEGYWYRDNKSFDRYYLHIKKVSDKKLLVDIVMPTDAILNDIIVSLKDGQVKAFGIGTTTDGKKAFLEGYFVFETKKIDFIIVKTNIVNLEQKYTYLYHKK